MDRLSQMIDVRIIDLAQHGVLLPSDRVGIVIAQPYLTLTPDEPYRCTAAAKDFQDDCQLSAEIVSRMLAFKDYANAVIKAA